MWRTHDLCHITKKRLETTGHSMKLKAQGVEPNDESEQLKSLINKIVAQGGSVLWDDT
jgi:hypothetical protein